MAAVEPVDADLPKALVKRIVKAKLSQEDISNGGDGTRDFQINKDALLAFCESGKVFIHYLTATANDVCKESKRQTISADDVMTALEDLDFAELVPDLKEALDGYRSEMREKNKKKAEQSKKRKLDKEQESGATGMAGEKDAGENGSMAEGAAAGGAEETAGAAGEARAAAGDVKEQQHEEGGEGAAVQAAQVAGHADMPGHTLGAEETQQGEGTEGEGAGVPMQMDAQ